MARFKVGDWVRLAVGDKMASWPAGKVLAVREDYQLPTIYAVEHEPGRPDRIVNWPEHRLEPAPPPVGERPRKYAAGKLCACAGQGFDPALWCACTPEPTDRAQQKVRLAREIEIEHNDTKPDGGTCKRCGQYFEGVVNSSLVHDCSSFKPRPEPITPNATDELSVYCPHYSVRGRACLECRNRAARARKARGGGA